MIRRLALALVGLASLSASAPAQDSSSHRILPTRTALERIGLEKLWYTVVPLAHSTELVSSVNLAEDLLFVQTTLGNMHVYDAETGKPLWNVTLGTKSLDARPATVNSDCVFVTNSRTLYCLDRKTGLTNWTANLGITVANVTRETATAIGAPAATESRVLVGLTSGKLVAFNARKTATSARMAARPAGSLAWTWQSNGAVTGRPIAAERVVAFGSEDKRVYVCLDSPPTLLYRFLTAGPISGSIAAFGTRTLVIPSEDHNLYAIDLFTGANKWTVPTGAPIKREPLVEKDLIYVTNVDGDVFAIDGNAGTILWTQKTGGKRLVALTPTRLYVDTRDHDLVILDRKTGRILSSPQETRARAGVDLHAYSVGFTNRQNDRIYYATPDGYVIALREIGVNTPINHKDPKAKKFGFVPDAGLPDESAPELKLPAETPPAETPPVEKEEKPVADPKP